MGHDKKHDEEEDASASDSSASDSSDSSDKKDKKKVKDKKKDKKHKKEKKEKKSKKEKKEKKSKGGKRGPKGAQWLTWRGNPYQPGSILHEAFKEASQKGGISLEKLSKHIKKQGGTPVILIRKLRTCHSKGWTWEADDAHGRLRLTNLKLTDKKWKRAA